MASQTFMEIIRRSTSPNFKIWREAYIYLEVKKTIIQYLDTSYPNFKNRYNLSDIFRIHLTQVQKNQLDIQLFAEITALSTVLKQNRQSLEEFLKDELLTKKILNKSSTIIINIR